MLFPVLLLITVGALVFKYFKTYSQFDTLNIPYAKSLPVLGSLWRSILRRENVSDDLKRIYNEVGDDENVIEMNMVCPVTVNHYSILSFMDCHCSCRYVGLYQFMTPVILLKDLELIKQITIKEFNDFGHHQHFVNNEMDDMFSQNLFSLRGDRWKDMRATLSPVFTGAKMRHMFSLIDGCANNMSEYVAKSILESGNNEAELHLLELSLRYMNDVVAAASFGLDINSFVDKENDFFSMGHRIGQTSFKLFVAILVTVWMPKLAKFFNMKLFDDDIEDYYRNIVAQNIAHREKENIVRSDMINSLMLIRRGHLKYERRHSIDFSFAVVQESEIGKGNSKREWTHDDLTAQAMVFYLASVDTSTSILSFTLCELAANKFIQDRLQREIQEAIKGNVNNLTYDIINRIKYLDMVVSEALRKWPPVSHFDRVSTNNVFDLGPVRTGEKNAYTVKKGDCLWIPFAALHRDPKYWDNPDNFDPERFSDENREKIIPGSYMPFGGGPRNCIGSRFAVTSMKTFLFRLFQNHSVRLSPTTPFPPELDRTAVVSRPTFNVTLIFRRKTRNVTFEN